MIVTVTMNPAIDRTVEINELKHGGLNRIEKVEYDAGGKGINVSNTIHELGGESIATGFLGGNAGKIIESVLNEKNIKADFVWVENETRTNTKIFEKNGKVTELNEKGSYISDYHLNQLIQKVESYANRETLFVFAGSIPGNILQNIYEKMIERVHKKGAKVLLDADGELLLYGMKAAPDIVKPNRRELEQYAGLTGDTTEKELIAAAENLQKEKGGAVIVSLGERGAIFILENYAAVVKSLSVKAHSTVGAGDAMVAAIAYSWDENLNTEQMICLCMAASAGAVTTIGTKPPSRALVDSLLPQVVIKRIKN